MKAVIKNVLKEEVPRFDAAKGVDVSTPSVVVEVEYQYDDGKFHSSARHAFLPEQLNDLSIFDRQAEILQRDIEDLENHKQAAEALAAAHGPVDDKVQEMRRHFKLSFNDKAPLSDSGKGE